MNQNHRLQLLDAETIGLELDEALPEHKPGIARHRLPVVADRLGAIPGELRQLTLDNRRVLRSLRGRNGPADECPGRQPDWEHKEHAARRAQRVSVLFDFLVALLVSRFGYQTPWTWAVLLGGAFSGLVASFSAAVALLHVDFEQLGESVRRLRLVVTATWVATILTIILITLARGGIVPLALLYLATPVLAAALTLQAGAYSALARAFGHVREIRERFEVLKAEQAELNTLRDELARWLRLPSRSKARTASPRASRHSPSVSAPARSQRPRTRLVAGASALALVAALAFGLSMTQPDPAVADQSLHLVVSVDCSNTGDMSEEASRVQRLIADGCPMLAEALGQVEEIEVHRWTGATEAWSAGHVFVLPRVSTVHEVAEASLPGFELARAIAHERAVGAVRARAVPVFSEVARALTAPWPEAPTRSCPYDAIARAFEAPPNTVTIVVTDLESFRCRPRSAGSIGGGPVCVVQVPRREGGETRDRMQERRSEVLRRFPGVLIIDSARLAGPAALRALGETLRRALPRSELP